MQEKLLVAERHQRIGRSAQHACQRHHFAACQRHKENGRQRHQQHGLQRNDGARCHRNGLAALEAEIQRIHMANDGKEGRQVHPDDGAAVVDGVVQMCAEKPLGQQHGRHALANVARKGKRRRPLAKGAQHVCHAGIVRAIVAHIFAEQQARHNDGETERPQQIGNDGAEQHVQQRAFCIGKHGRPLLLFRLYRSISFPRARESECAPACPPGRTPRGSGFRYISDRKNGTVAWSCKSTRR